MSSDSASAAATSANNHHQHQNHRNSNSSNRNATAASNSTSINATTNNNARLQPATTTITPLLDTPLDPNDEDAHIRRGLDVIQSMIDASANRLEGLRHHCSTHVELTQHEIRMLESKLVRMFTEMLATKAKLPERLPSGLPPATEAELRQWMRIVGLSTETQLAVLPRCDSVDTLLQLNDSELRGLLLLSAHPRKEEEARRLVCAMAHLRHCRQLLRTGAGGYKEGAFTSASMPSDMFWDSWDRHHHHGHHGHHHREHRERGGSGGGIGGSGGLAASSGGISPRLLRNHPGGGLAPKPKPLSRTMASSVQSLHATTGGGSPQHQQQQPASLPPGHPQFSPPSADAAAAAVAATLNQQRRRTLTPEETGGGGLLRTPSPSPPSSPSTTTSSSATTASTMYMKNSGVRGAGGGGGAFPATPPLKRHLQTPEQTPQHQQQQQQISLITKSKSHESQLLHGPGGATLSTVGGDAAAAHPATDGGGGGTSVHPIRSRLHTEPSPDNHQHHHHYHTSHNNDSHQASPGHQHQHPQYLHSSQLAHHNDHLQVPPRSPVIALGQQQQQQQRSANIMQTSTGSSSCGGGDSPLHGHYFNKKFKVMSNCDLCNKSMFFGFKCKECKYRCHKDCEPLLTAICPASVLRKSQAMQQADVALMGSHSPTLNRSGGGFGAATAALLSAGGGLNSLRGSAGVRRDRLRSTDFGNMGGVGGVGGMESGGSAGSSCNSSTPSSPALLTLSAMHSGGSQSTTNPMSTSVVSASSSSTTSSTFAAGGGGVGGAVHSTQPQPAAKTQFKFPDIYKPDTVGSITLEKHFSKQEEQRQQQQQHSAAAVPPSPRAAKAAVKSPPDVVVSAESAASAAARAASLAAAAAADATAVVNGTAEDGGQTAAANHLQVPRRQMQIPTVTVKDVLTSSAVDTASASGGNSEATTTTTSSTSTSNDSDRTAIRLDSADDPDEADDRIEADGHWSRQNSVSLKEWDIPIEDIVLMEKIGDGRFGTVHRAQWHGAVAIKILKEDYLDNEAFKVEVATFKKTRHENVVLFMGACIRPQAIVTSLCKGNTLYTHIHVRKDRFNLNKTTMVAQQISLGMGYLHARNITHKDLKTKNIFLENGKVIITDFGLFSATKLEYDERLGLRVPYGWLAYLAPEIMQQLQPRPPEHRDALPFSSKSDIYAFGTVWYELLCGELPFRAQAPEAIIFQVGRGMKQSLANLQAARDVKEILMTCWSFDYNLRPDFSAILQQLEKLPKKRLARSPSHPLQLSRSAESVF